jgi:hypothetical protein
MASPLHQALRKCVQGGALSGVERSDNKNDGPLAQAVEV